MAYSQSVIDAFNRAIQATGASPKVAKALFEAGIVESGLRNLNYGDRDSLGALQQRPSQGWQHATDPYLGAIDFLKQAIPLSGKYGSAGQLAQAVQRSAYPGRYAAQGSAASALLGGTSSRATPTPSLSSTPSASSSNSLLSQPSLQPQAGGQDFSSLLSSLLSQSQPQASSSSLGASPTATSAPFAQGARPLLASSSAPASAQDRVSAALSLAQALGGPSPTLGSGSGSQTAAAAPEAPGMQRTSTSKTTAYHPGGAKGSGILELIHNDGSGPGYGIKNGQNVNGSQVFSAVWAGHQNHVHVAAGPKTVVALGKLAQSMGLHVSENPHFGGVDPAAHVPGSYHDKGEAIDASGTPKQMDAFARAVEQYNRTHTLPSI